MAVIYYSDTISTNATVTTLITGDIWTHTTGCTCYPTHVYEVRPWFDIPNIIVSSIPKEWRWFHKFFDRVDEYFSLPKARPVLISRIANYLSKKQKRKQKRKLFIAQLLS